MAGTIVMTHISWEITLVSFTILDHIHLQEEMHPQVVS